MAHTGRKANVIDGSAVASSAQLDLPCHCHVVAVRLVCADHKARAVRRHGDRGHSAHDLRTVPFDKPQIFLVDKGHGAIAGADDDVRAS